MKDYYDILGVSKSADKDEIKKAFRKLAAQYHPDKKTGDEARFKEVSEAYSVLGNEKKRAEYDTYGRSYAGGAPGGGFGGGFGGFQGVNINMDDIFENFGDIFGGMGGGARQKRGSDISIDLQLSFKDAIFGTERTVTLTKQNLCDTCEGSGAKPGAGMSSCSACNGNGKIRENRETIMGVFSTVRTCSECQGAGKIPKEKCSDCHGAGVRRSEESIQIKVPAGVSNGEMIRMTGRGEAVKGGTSGDLYIKLHVESHKNITRNGNTLYTTLHVKLTDALLGEKYTVETLDDDIELKVPAGVTHGEMLRIKNKGVPTGQGDNRGDFMVKVAIDMPKKLSRKAKKCIEELKNEGI